MSQNDKYTDILSWRTAFVFVYVGMYGKPVESAVLPILFALWASEYSCVYMYVCAGLRNSTRVLM